MTEHLHRLTSIEPAHLCRFSRMQSRDGRSRTCSSLSQWLAQSLIQAILIGEKAVRGSTYSQSFDRTATRVVGNRCLVGK